MTEQARAHGDASGCPGASVLALAADRYLSLRDLAAYSSLSIRKLRDCLGDRRHPLPCYRIGGKILVKRTEFDAWAQGFRNGPASSERGDEVGRAVDDLLGSLTNGRARLQNRHGRNEDG